MSTKPDGPWKTADSVPREIYTIPSSSPVYNVTYVTQTNATATTVESSSGSATTSQGHNPYAQWGSSVATRNGQAIQTGQVTTAPGTTPGYRISTGQRGIVTQGANRTVARGTNGTYVGHDGDVDRKDSRAPGRIEPRHKILAPLQDSRQPKITSTCNPTLLTD